MMLSIVLIKAAAVCGVLAWGLWALMGFFNDILGGVNGRLSTAFFGTIACVFIVAIVLMVLCLVGAFGAFAFDVRL